MSRITYLKLLSLAAFGTLFCGALIIYFLKPHPCDLCAYQRDVWLLIFLWSFFAWFDLFRARLHFFFYGSFFFVLLSFALASFHTGVEYGFWDLPKSFCRARLDEAIFFNEDPKALIMPACKKPFYLIEGISLALLNMLSSLFFALLGLSALFNKGKRS